MLCTAKRVLDGIEWTDYTKNGRIVYGGGGIWPDQEIPLDDLYINYLNSKVRLNTKRPIFMYATYIKNNTYRPTPSPLWATSSLSCCQRCWWSVGISFRIICFFHFLISSVKFSFFFIRFQSLLGWFLVDFGAGRVLSRTAHAQVCTKLTIQARAGGAGGAGQGGSPDCAGIPACHGQRTRRGSCAARRVQAGTAPAPLVGVWSARCWQDYGSCTAVGE